MVIGIICALLTGVVWCFVGIFYSHIGRRKLNIYDISVLVNLVALLLMSILAGAKIQHSDLEWSLDWRSAAFVSAAGGVNFAGSLILQRALCYGKQSVLWALGQSAQIIPFIMISLIFGEEMSTVKIVGTALIVAGMFAVSRKKTIRITLNTPIRLGVLFWR